MSLRPEPDIAIVRRREQSALPLSDPQLRREIAAGRVIRVVPGSFVRRAQWDALAPIDRHLVTVVETLDRCRTSQTVGFHSAAAVWGIDKIGPWPTRTDVIVPRRGGGRSSGHLRRWTIAADDADTVSWRGHEITTPAQTALDLARTRPFTEAVIALDQALWERRPGGPLTTLDELWATFDAASPRRGDARARTALAFASPRADSVRESQSRSLLHQLGFPEPVLQQPFRLPSGRVVRTDFFFAEFGHVGEFDGVGKYIDPQLRGGRTPEQVLIEEKDRGDELRRIVRRLSRWRVPDLRDARRLYDLLRLDGLPSTRPRPPRGLVLC